ncbi:hypothetical protein [Desulfoluna sp.]|uniref:hypothetical protein n=1 Tax=Desulfoluna sp. TaxID=2045199 RepID=UPI0026088792|nr:hypothetical protein [Desulfoluna sp.]
MLRCHLSPLLPCLLLLLLLGFFLTPAPCAAEDPNSAFVEIGGNHSPKFGGAQGGLSQYNDHTAFLAGFALFGSSAFDNPFAGITLAARFHTANPFHGFITPFVGVGGFAGYSQEEESAEEDDLDNDDDGEVDEKGEVKQSRSDSLAILYPEAGIHINIKGDGLFTLSARYNLTSKGHDLDHWVYALGFTIPFQF